LPGLADLVSAEIQPWWLNGACLFLVGAKPARKPDILAEAVTVTILTVNIHHCSRSLAI
jgi:hypothetical protein